MTGADRHLVRCLLDLLVRVAASSERGVRLPTATADRIRVAALRVEFGLEADEETADEVANG